MNIREEEDGRKETDGGAAAHNDAGKPVWWLVFQAETWRSFVDDGQSQDRSNDEEKGRRGPDSPGDRLSPHVDHGLDEHEDEGGEATRYDGGQTQAGKDGAEALAPIPAPLDFISAGYGDADAGDCRDERVCGRDVSRVLGAPHDPRRGGDEGTREGEHLDSGLALEDVGRDNAILDGFGCSGADGDGT